MRSADQPQMRAESRAELNEAGLSARLVTDADLGNQDENRARRDLLAVTRGYGQGKNVSNQSFPSPASGCWVRAKLEAAEVARVRYIDDSYWNDLSGGRRLPADALAVFPVAVERLIGTAPTMGRWAR